MKPDVPESTEYESLIGVKDKNYEHSTLEDFLEIEFEDEKEWMKHWKAMPEFSNNENPPHKRIMISFRTKEDYDTFIGKYEEHFDQKLTEKTKSIWYPKLEIDRNSLKRWIEENDESN